MRWVIYVKYGCSYFKHSEWDISFLQIYQWIGKNMFSIGKNGILNSFLILCILQKFWPCITQADNMWNQNNLSASLHSTVVDALT